jgi:3-methyl-2-oxobutanoate hydroxymethyltransferase
MRESGRKIVCVTAYDACFGAIADEVGVDLILVGDSVGNTTLGYEGTVPVTLEQMVHHTRATRAGVKRALLVADLPFGSYQVSAEDAVRSAVVLVKAGAEAVKLEGSYPEAVAAIERAGIPVLGHLGMTPQAVNRFGGHKVQGKGDAADGIRTAAIALDRAGASAIVLELIPAGLASDITEAINCPTIGIGAGVFCSGQIQVIHDVLGLNAQAFRHAKNYMDGRKALGEAIGAYALEVREAAFPTGDHSF